jgi:hypothetical protein
MGITDPIHLNIHLTTKAKLALILAENTLSRSLDSFPDIRIYLKVEGGLQSPIPSLIIFEFTSHICKPHLSIFPLIPFPTHRRPGLSTSSNISVCGNTWFGRGGVVLCKVLKCILHGRWFSLEGCLLAKLVNKMR